MCPVQSERGHLSHTLRPVSLFSRSGPRPASRTAPTPGCFGGLASRAGRSEEATHEPLPQPHPPSSRRGGAARRPRGEPDQRRLPANLLRRRTPRRLVHQALTPPGRSRRPHPDPQQLPVMSPPTLIPGCPRHHPGYGRRRSCRAASDAGQSHRHFLVQYAVGTGRSACRTPSQHRPAPVLTSKGKGPCACALAAD